MFFFGELKGTFFTPKNLRSRYLWVALIWIFNSGHEFLKSRHLLTYWWGSHPTGSFGNSHKKWCQHAKHLSGFVEQTRAAYKLHNTNHQPTRTDETGLLWWWRKMKKEIKKGSCQRVLWYLQTSTERIMWRVFENESGLLGHQRQPSAHLV